MSGGAPRPPAGGTARRRGISGIVREIALGLLVAAGVTLVVLVLLEIGFRVFAPQNTALNVSQWDPTYGWRNRAGARGFFRTPEFRMEVRINALGMRDDETTREKPAGTFRILGLGDSFAFGHGVAAESCFFSITERELSARSQAGAGPRVEVLNTGVGKWGTVAQFLYFRNEGAGFSPDATVLAFCVENDFENNADCNLLRLEGDRLVRVENPEPTVRKAQNVTRLIPGYGFLAEHSHLVNFMRVRASHLEANLIAARTRGRERAADTTGHIEPEHMRLRMPITLMTLDSLAAETRRAQAPLLVLFVPSRWQCEPRTPGARGLYLDPRPHAAMVERTIAHLDSLGVPVVYPLAELTAASEKRRTYFDESHLNEEGSRVVANALVEGLATAGLAPGPPAVSRRPASPSR